MTHTSLKLSKLLAENGCELESELCYCKGHMWFHDGENGEYADCDGTDLLDPEDLYCHVAGFNSEYTIPAYDILNDLCVKYAKEVFGDYTIEEDYVDYVYNGVGINKSSPAYEFHAKETLDLLQQGKQEEAEDYIWEHCLFNPKNQ